MGNDDAVKRPLPQPPPGLAEELRRAAAERSANADGGAPEEESLPDELAAEMEADSCVNSVPTKILRPDGTWEESTLVIRAGRGYSLLDVWRGSYSDVSAKLVKYDAARKALQEACSIDEVLQIKNVAETARAYALQARDNELLDRASEIKIRAERRAGELLIEMIRCGTLKERGRPGKCSRGVTLFDLGIERRESARWKRFAEVAPERWERVLAALKKGCMGVTRAAVEKGFGPRPKQKKKLSSEERYWKLLAAIDRIYTPEERREELDEHLCKLSLTRIVERMNERREPEPVVEPIDP